MNIKLNIYTKPGQQNWLECAIRLVERQNIDRYSFNLLTTRLQNKVGDKYGVAVDMRVPLAFYDVATGQVGV